MSQITRVAKVLLRQKASGSAITVAAIAKAAKMTKDSVYKRIYDLHTVEGFEVNRDYRMVNGKRKVYYSLAS